MNFFVYYLYSQSLKKHYIGKTDNIQRRLKEHNNEEEIYTKKGAPWQLIGYIECETSLIACHLEKKLKNAKNSKYVHWYITTNGKTVE